MPLQSTKAVMLAAGYGTRLRPLTDTVPKALVPLAGIPLVRHGITRLLQAGISSIGINAHHHAERITTFIAGQHDCRIHISHEPVILGSAGGIGAFRDFIDRDDFFIACNADTVSNITCDTFLSEFLHHGPLVTMILTDDPATNNVCINANREIIDLRDSLHPHDTAARLSYSGIAFMRREFLDLIPPGTSELVPLLLELIGKKPGCVRAVIAHDAAWRDIGTIDSYLRAHAEILLERAPLIPENAVPPGPLLLGEHTHIDTDCMFEGFVVIGSNCRIGSGCVLRNCVIWDNTSLAAGTHLQRAVCSPEFTVNA